MNMSSATNKPYGYLSCPYLKKRNSYKSHCAWNNTGNWSLTRSRIV